MDALPDPSAFDPSPEEEGELRERLLRAGEIRAGGPAAEQGQDALPAPAIATAATEDAPSSAESFAPSAAESFSPSSAESFGPESEPVESDAPGAE